jgi:hypothetical protein
MRRAEFNPLEAPSVGSTNRKVFFSNDPLSSNITSKSHSQNPVTTQTTYSSIPAKESRVSTMPKPIKVIDDFKFISFSLIVNKNFNVNDSIDINWSLIRKNLMDLFCNNFNMEVKSIYSISLDEDDLQKNYKIEQGRNRLEEIEGDKKGNKFNIISSGEHVAKMEVLKREMLQKWEVEDKVGTLKIIIHCTKMLNDVFTPKFYTHKFLIISDILDIFSKLVYERIYKLSFTSDKSTEFNDINPGMINNTAKDICYNWILKCSCIRELLPRIYIDITFLRIFKFIYTEKEIEQKILTIAKMIRGLSHPLISFYVSMYLAKISLNLYPKFKSFILIILDNISKFILNEEMIKKLGYDNITLEEMKKVLEPCVEWIIYCLSKNMTTVNKLNILEILLIFQIILIILFSRFKIILIFIYLISYRTNIITL